MGESPINEVDADHPFVASALNQLNRSNTLEQSRGWWFNSDQVKLLPDSTTGYVYLPADCIDIDSPYPSIVKRGNRLYDRTNATYDLRNFISQTGSPIVTVVIREVPFADLPMTVQHLVAARTALDFQADFDGDDSKYRKLGQEYQQIYNVVGAEDIRHNRVNLLHTPSVQSKLRLIRPISRFARRGW